MTSDLTSANVTSDLTLPVNGSCLAVVNNDLALILGGVDRNFRAVDTSIMVKVKGKLELNVIEVVSSQVNIDRLISFYVSWFDISIVCIKICN